MQPTQRALCAEMKEKKLPFRRRVLLPSRHNKAMIHVHELYAYLLHSQEFYYAICHLIITIKSLCKKKYEKIVIRHLIIQF